MNDIDEQIKEHIDDLKGDAQKDFAWAQGWVKVHLVYVAGAIGAIVGIIVGILIGHHSG